jgi:cytochrome c5
MERTIPLATNMDNTSPFTDSQYAQTASAPSSQPSSPFTDSQYTQNPDDVNAARKLSGSQNYDGLCEAFVEKVAGLPNMGASAAQAWDKWVQQGKASSDYHKAPPGSLIYFAPDKSNGGDGHVAITDGKGNIIGATDTGVQAYPLKDWIAMTGQKVLGVVAPHK